MGKGSFYFLVPVPASVGEDRVIDVLARRWGVLTTPGRWGLRERSTAVVCRGRRRADLLILVLVSHFHCVHLTWTTTDSVLGCEGRNKKSPLFRASRSSLIFGSAIIFLISTLSLFGCNLTPADRQNTFSHEHSVKLRQQLVYWETPADDDERTIGLDRSVSGTELPGYRIERSPDHATL